MSFSIALLVGTTHGAREPSHTLTFDPWLLQVDSTHGRLSYLSPDPDQQMMKRNTNDCSRSTFSSGNQRWVVHLLHPPGRCRPNIPLLIFPNPSIWLCGSLWVCAISDTRLISGKRFARSGRVWDLSLPPSVSPITLECRQITSEMIWVRLNVNES